ncbi:hypothetical protein L9F63_010527 [Diploptera punctata]|uniref:Ionotropic glutamate receptor C-terminal domain-containing protein n=1 Tax=Diploptera punctata TaxID=6984 RepID=A0AAD8EQH2_DIPPU|nr:hypothetical protein L9F63_010527 [Diploptera punctata]
MRKQDIYLNFTRESLEEFKEFCTIHFEPWLTFNVLSSNIPFSEHQNKILEMIHSAQSYSLMVSSLTSDYLFTFETFDGFVIIMNPDEFLDDIKRIKQLMFNLSLRNAKVIIVILGIPRSLNFAFFLVDFFSLYEAIIIVKDNNGDLKLMTWAYDTCGHFKEPVYLGFCRTDVVNISKFPTRPKIFKNCNFQYSPTDDFPFSMYDFTKPTVVKEGIELILLKIISSQLGFSIVYFNLTNVATFRNKESIGGTWYCAGRDSCLPFMVRYYTQSFWWYVSRAKNRPHWTNVLRVFDLYIWVLIILSLIFVSLSLKFLNILRSFNLGKCILDLWAVFLNTSADRIPVNFRFRTLFFTWVTFCLILTTVFQAYMTNFFIDPGKQHQIDSFQELIDSNFILAMGYEEIYCWQMMSNGSFGYVLFYSNCLMLKHFAENSKIATLVSQEVLLYNLNLLGMLNRTAEFHKFSNYVINRHKTLVMHNTSPHVPAVNKILTRLVEAGIVDKIVNNFVDPSAMWERMKVTGNLQDGYVSLSSSTHFLRFTTFSLVWV